MQANNTIGLRVYHLAMRFKPTYNRYMNMIKTAARQPVCKAYMGMAKVNGIGYPNIYFRTHHIKRPGMEYPISLDDRLMTLQRLGR